MKGKVLLGQNLIWVLLLLGQIYGCKSCIQKERKGLLDLKRFVIPTNEGWSFDAFLPTWTNDTNSDCCQWEGVECNRTSRRVVRLSLNKFEILESYPFNLSLLHPFEEVQDLDLSGYKLNGLFDDVEGYNSLRRLRNLEILDLSSNEFNNSIFPFLNVATSLTTLSLSDNHLDGHFPVRELKNLTNLEVLDLHYNRLNGSMKTGEFPHLKKLRALYLSSNGFSSSVELQALKNFTNLEVLDLRFNFINGLVLREVVCEIKNLRELDLSGNYFVGQLPLCLGSLNKLQSLELSYNENQLSENLTSSFSSLESLEYLSLSGNNITGFISLSPLANLTKLKVLKLSLISGAVQVETESTWQPTFQLRVAIVRFCRLEKIPNFLIYQKNLRLVDLSGNRLSRNIPTWLLENNPELEVLLLQKNSFTIFQLPTTVHKLQLLDFSGNDIGGLLPDNISHHLPDLQHMDVSNNRFQGNLPSSMGEMKKISFIDLSRNNFSGELPKSLFTGCVSLSYLLLSHNKFTGRILPSETSITSLKVWRMDNNLFTGKIGDGGLSLVDLEVIDMSNNFLTGAIPSWISDLSFLMILLISNNLLDGTVPPSLLAKPHLNFLDLSGNLLAGSLPSNVSSMYGIRMFLNDNNLTGPIPRTLLENAMILDLQNNKLSGIIPQFVNTGKLSILLLRGNNLTGSIPRKLCDLTSMRLLDLSHNKLSGFMPSCLHNLSFGMGREEHLKSDYSVYMALDGSSTWEFYKSTLFVEEFSLGYPTSLDVEVKFATKHRYEFYSGASNFLGGTLDIMYGLDLSSNELSGAIPAELGDLSTLRALNLSRNFLSSSIPDSFSKLKDIESLDLSYNMLQGSIPRQLTNLTSLAVFNVSYNNLSGTIPQGVQFNTFSEDSYIGNPLLCGPPTNKSCTKHSSEGTENGEEEEEDEDTQYIDMLVFYWSSGSTYVTALMGILLLMCFDSPWRRAWLRLVDAFIASAKSLSS